VRCPTSQLTQCSTSRKVIGGDQGAASSLWFTTRKVGGSAGKRASSSVSSTGAVSLPQASSTSSPPKPAAARLPGDITVPGRKLLDIFRSLPEKTNVTMSTEGERVSLRAGRSRFVKSLDYMVRVSDKTYYVSPTRGQLGNAPKVIWAAPFVATGSGSAEIVSHGKCHRVEIDLDRIAQKPIIKHEITPAVVNTGTSAKIRWTDSTRLLREPAVTSYNVPPPTAAELVSGFVAFNPHTTFILDGKRFERTSGTFKKWSPQQPSSAHWYNSETLRDLIAAYIALPRRPTLIAVTETVDWPMRGFRGLGLHRPSAAWGVTHGRSDVLAGDRAPRAHTVFPHPRRALTFWCRQKRLTTAGASHRGHVCLSARRAGGITIDCL